MAKCVMRGPGYYETSHQNGVLNKAYGNDWFLLTISDGAGWNFLLLANSTEMPVWTLGFRRQIGELTSDMKVLG